MARLLFGWTSRLRLTTSQIVMTLKQNSICKFLGQCQHKMIYGVTKQKRGITRRLHWVGFKYSNSWEKFKCRAFVQYVLTMGTNKQKLSLNISVLYCFIVDTLNRIQLPKYFVRVVIEYKFFDSHQAKHTNLSFSGSIINYANVMIYKRWRWTI